METTQPTVESPKTPKNNKTTFLSLPTWMSRGLGGFIVFVSVDYFGQTFNRSVIDEFTVLVIAIIAGYFYHGLKRKIKIKNETVRILITYFILLFVSAVLIGFCTAIVR